MDNALLDLIYEAAAVPETWPRVLEKLGEMVRTRAPTFVESSPVWRAAHPDVPVMPGDDVRAWAALPLRVEDGTEERLLGARPDDSAKMV